MDIMLERILSLIPKKENGDFKHGSLAAFARPLGFKDGHIVSDWIAGNSRSYANYLYQIASQHGVSVEWLRGETNEKSPLVHADERALDDELVSKLTSLTPEERQKVDAFVQGLLANR